PKTQSTKTEPGMARLTIDIPEKGAELLTKIAELYGVTVDEKAWEAIKMLINMELETDLGDILGTGQFDTTYCRKHVSPETVAQEAQV
ncbi:unnamed protein product, partial [marine sediment metagenome]